MRAGLTLTTTTPATTTAMRTAILSRVSRIASQTSSRNVPRIRPDAPAPAYPLCPASATPAHALGCSPILRASPAHPTRASLKPALGTDTTEYRPTQAIEERSSMASNASRPKPGDPGGRNDGIAHKAPWAHLSQYAQTFQVPGNHTHTVNHTYMHRLSG